MKSHMNLASKAKFYKRHIALTIVLVACAVAFSTVRVQLDQAAMAAPQTPAPADFDSAMHSFDRSLQQDTPANAASSSRTAEPVGTLIRKMILNQHYRHQ